MTIQGNEAHVISQEGARKALDDDVVGRAFVVFLASESVVAVCIMGGPTCAGGAGVGAVDGETQIAPLYCIMSSILG